MSPSPLNVPESFAPAACVAWVATKKRVEKKNNNSCYVDDFIKSEFLICLNFLNFTSCWVKLVYLKFMLSCLCNVENRTVYKIAITKNS